MASKDFVSFCPKCKMEYLYKPFVKNEDKKQVCGYKGCDGEMIHSKITAEENVYIEHISEDREFLIAMNNLRNTDVIAYKEKIAQYKAEFERTHAPLSNDENDIYKQPSNLPKCPTCGSTNIRKIKTGERTASIIGFGIFSRKANKTWKCENCGYLW